MAHNWPAPNNQTTTQKYTRENTKRLLPKYTCSNQGRQAGKPPGFLLAARTGHRTLTVHNSKDFVRGFGPNIANTPSFCHDSSSAFQLLLCTWCQMFISIMYSDNFRGEPDVCVINFPFIFFIPHKYSEHTFSCSQPKCTSCLLGANRRLYLLC